MPRVSVIVAAYNAEPFIGRAIESVLSQTITDLEIIVSDDRSKDGTCAVVEAIAARDSRVKLIRNEKNGGPGFARNGALRAAVGEWIAVLDADDWFEPARLETLLDMTEKANLDLVADNQSFVLDGTAQPFRLLRPERRGNARVLTADDVLRGDRIGRTGNFGLLKPIVRKKVVDEHNISYDESNGLGEDFFWLLHCIRHAGKMLFVSDPLYNYRIHQTSWSNTLTKKNYVEMRKLLDRNKNLFDANEAPTTAHLLARRCQDLDKYFRYQELVEPLKHRDLGGLIRRAAADPAALRFLVPGMAIAFWRRCTWHLGRARLKKA
jgi:succinoglycan biosynthesis protein ExoO